MFIKLSIGLATSRYTWRNKQFRGESILADHIYHAFEAICQSRLLIILETTSSVVVKPFFLFWPPL